METKDRVRNGGVCEWTCICYIMGTTFMTNAPYEKQSPVPMGTDADFELGV